MTTFGDQIYQHGGVPVSSGDMPAFGDFWFVDGTNGTAGGSGATPGDAISTVQLAITAQLANTTSLGDVIYVLPGTYAENDIDDNLTKLQVIGVTCGGTPSAVKIAPSTGGAYAGTLTNSAFRNISFRNTSSTGATEACVAVKMDHSIIDNCEFIGVTDDASSVGLRIGAETDATWEHMLYSIVSNCIVGQSGGRTSELGYGIVFGNVGDTDNNATRQFMFSRIFNNLIRAQYTGIYMNTAASNCGGGIIHYNDIGGIQTGSGGTSVDGIAHYADDDDRLCKVHYNTIVAGVDCIKGFTDDNVMGNIVSANGATPDGENPAKS